ncbi:MAG TPA: hypothetical protein PK771_09365, partial [Spirochaetota bacterium]|nr:hypothetical protein [Spirochaetota bacterium]
MKFIIKVFLLLEIFLFLFLLGCSSVENKPLADTSFYSMVYSSSAEAIKQSGIANKLEKSDRVMVINVNRLFTNLPSRFSNSESDKTNEGIDYNSLVELWPHTITMMENGFNQGLLNESSDFGGFEKIDYAKYPNDIPNDYKIWLKDNSYVFNTSPFKKEFLKKMNEVHGVTKILFYRLDNAVVSKINLNEENFKTNKYFGALYYFKLIDIKNLNSQDTKVNKQQVKILYSGHVTAKSADFPDKNISEISIENLNISKNIKEKLGQLILDKNKNINITLLKADDIGIFGDYPITNEDFFIEDLIATNIGSIDGITVNEKVGLRQYKYPSVINNSLFNTNPLLASDYREIERFYYSTRYILTYRILWANQTIPNKVFDNSIVTKDTQYLKNNLLGIHFKLIDTTDN